MLLAQPLSFRVLISPSLCGLQFVSAPCSVAFFLPPDKSPYLRSPGCECISLLSLSFRVPTSSSLCGFQEVSRSLELAFFSCPDKSLSRYSSVCGCSFNAFVRAANMSSTIVASEFFFPITFSLFRCSHFFPGAVVSISQTGILSLRCAVIIFLFHLDFTNGYLASSSYV